MTEATRSRLVRACAGCLAAFVVLALLRAAAWDSLAAADRRWSDRAYAFTTQHPAFQDLASAVTFLGNGWWITVVTAAVAGMCATAGRWRLAWWLVVTVAGSALLCTALKNVMEQVRPEYAGVLTSAHGYSFPSGHTQAATVTYVAVVLVVGWQVLTPSRGARTWGTVLVVVTIGAVGLSRVYLGAHWASDVVGGWLLGSAWVIAATLLLLGRGRHAQREPDDSATGPA